MISDNYLARIFAWTVCIISGLIALAITWQVIVQHEGVDIDLKEIAFLLFGGLLGRLTTQKHPEQGDEPAPVTVANSVYDPVPTAPNAPIPTAETTAGSNPVVELHPDAPEASDL